MNKMRVMTNYHLYFSMFLFLIFLIKLVYNHETCTEEQPYKKSNECTSTCTENDIFITKICIPVSFNEDDITNMIENIKNYISNLNPSDINEDILIEGEGITYQITTNNLIENENQENNLIHLTLSDECLSSIGEATTNDYFIILINVINTNYTTYNTDKIILKSNDIESTLNELCLGKTVSFAIPVSISSSILPIYESIKEEYDYDIFNIDDSFYTDICELYTTEDKIDISLSKRIELFGDYSLEVCGIYCDYHKYDIETNKIFCDCEIKNGEEEVNKGKKNLGRQISDKLKEFLDLINFDVMLCFKLLFENKVQLIKNAGFMLMTITLFLFLLIMIIICCILKNKITKIALNFPGLKIKMKKYILEKLQDIKMQIKQELNNQVKNNNVVIEKEDEKENEIEKKEPQAIKIAPNQNSNLKLNLQDEEEDEEEEEEEDDEEGEEEEDEVEDKKDQIIKDEPKIEEPKEEEIIPKKGEEIISKNENENISKNNEENMEENNRTNTEERKDTIDNNVVNLNNNNYQPQPQSQPYPFDYNQYYANLQNYYNYLNYYNYMNAIISQNMNNFYNNINNNNNNNNNNDENFPEQSEEEISPRNNNNAFTPNKLTLVIPYDKIKEKIKSKNKDEIKKPKKTKNKTKGKNNKNKPLENKNKSKKTKNKSKSKSPQKNKNKGNKGNMKFEINFKEFFKQNPPKKVIISNEEEISSKKDDINSLYNFNENQNQNNLNRKSNMSSMNNIVIYDNNKNNNINDGKQNFNQIQNGNDITNALNKKDDIDNIQLNIEEEKLYKFGSQSFYDCLKKLPEEKRLEFFTDEELNSLDYQYAVDADKRSFFSQYFAFLKRQNILLFCFSYCANDYNLSIIKFSFFIFEVVLFIVISAFFFTDNTLNNIYDKKNKFDFKFMIRQLGLTFIICFGLNLLFKALIRADSKVTEIKEEKESIDNVVKSIRCRLTFYFIFSMIILIFGWFYISSFCFVYRNTQIILFKCAAYSFIATIFYPFIFCLLAAAFRNCALGDQNKGKKCLYEFSKFLSYI